MISNLVKLYGGTIVSGETVKDERQSINYFIDFNKDISSVRSK